MKGLLLILIVDLGTSLQADKFQRFCYISSWARFRPNAAKFGPENVGVHLCTHIAYAFSDLDETGTRLYTPEVIQDPILSANRIRYFGEKWKKRQRSRKWRLYRRFTSLKRRNPNLKVLLSVGGWDMGSAKFALLVYNDSNIKQFARNTCLFLRRQGFDGIDLDWEFPGSRGSPLTDKHRFTRLVQILRQTFESESRRFGRERLLITIAVSGDLYQIKRSYEARPLARYSDLLTLMTYDMHEPWENSPVAEHHAALYRGPRRSTKNIDYIANYYTKKLGVPRNKLLIGVPFYSRTYTVHPKSDRVMAPGRPGPYTNSPSILAYYEVCPILKNGASSFSYKQMVPHVIDGNQWIGYDDERSISEKVRYVVSNGYAGVSIWSLDLDDFRGSCGRPFPLMNAVKDAFTRLKKQRKY